jgi:anaerobic selenocysteine-containing dehydrogenase
MKRRQFIILTGVGAAGTTLLSACGHPENKLIPALVPDDEYVPGIDYWKASTCGMCAAGCGIVVRTREHKANKIEGNPLHPVNRGALCARGQAGLQVLYNPDRITGPLKRVGERGSGEFAPISWDEAISTLAGKLREIKSQGRASQMLFATSDRYGATGHVAVPFMLDYGSNRIFADEAEEEIAANSYVQSYGAAEVPFFDIANARYLVSFGARFLETWHSPVMYSLAYSDFRRPRSTGNGPHPRGKFVHVEPRMSLTAANADEWLPAMPGSEGLVALGMAQVIIREGLTPIANARSTEGAPGTVNLAARGNLGLDRYAPEQTSDATGIPADKIIRIAREFAASKPALAIGGGAVASFAQGADSMRAINFLNVLAGNLNQPGGVLFASDYFDPLTRWTRRDWAGWGRLRDHLPRTGELAAALIHGANPAFTAPEFAEKLQAIPFIASFSSFPDETTRMADLILPDHTYLERWDIRRFYWSKSATATITRPVVAPEHDTRHTADVLIALDRELGGSIAASSGLSSAEQVVKDAAMDLRKQPGSVEGATPDEFWTALLERGVRTAKADEARHQPSANPPPAKLSPAAAPPSGDYPFVLLTYEHPALGHGQHANLPWLQELPDPMTAAIWGSWVELNPKTAERLGIKDGDLVELRTEKGSARLPAVLYPAIRPDVIAMPYGQGHTAYGMYAAGRGINPAVLGATVNGAATIWAKVTKAEGGPALIRFGTNLPEKPETRRD